mmetsp:Transcript_25626/g.35408  ORF Transcript_25626/g.35408 Transcript_25626/m.35408 type:complete len:294 (+) Transcript_25626:273-1154(+)|eukprot:CAMPEP_0196574378 /NCGR_PEP_ID=MMETSP1081-20130531/4103_1 /TAXON_ID=36882 /ORGANISM="Pyramimonas amylifera, Strain CCMP720" /LENGTH=293 /DNA_ID=CAMNT_0041892379 /DNA_START=227 /DNA_END=1108 /DNA_ORIENTATION=+
MEGYQGQGVRSLGLGSDSIPKEVLAVLPTDPADQLELAHRISNHAYAAKVTALEAENNSLRQTVMQRQSQIKALERRVSNLELEMSEAQEKARNSMEEQTKLVGEKNALIGTVKKLNRDLAKLDNFKRNLLQSLQDDEEEVKDQSFGVGGDFGGERLVNNVLSGANNTSRISEPSLGGGGGTPPRYHQYAGAQTTPASSAMLGKGGESPPGAGGSLSGGLGGSPRVDGKEFFRQARARLAYEQFSQFLQNIKELNAHRQTREETLKKATTIFGSENSDLYASFETLLSRHLPI